MSDGLALLHRHLNGETLDDAQREALSRWVCESSENARLVAELTNLDRTIVADLRSQAGVPLVGVSDAELVDEAGSNSDTNELEPIHIDSSTPLTRKAYASALSYVIEHTFTLRRVAVLAIAAALFLGVVPTIVFITGGDGTPEEIVDLPNYTPATPTPDPNRVVATITDQSQAQWVSATSRGELPDRTLLGPNQRLTLARGFAEITTNRGAVVLVQAPATVETTDKDNAIRLHRGKLVGRCDTRSSKGFVVHAPGLDVVDLGTEFGVEADAVNGSTVLVMEGSVRAQPTKQSPRAFEPVVLEKDQARRIEPTSGSLEMIAAAEAPVFHREPQHPYVAAVMEAKPILWLKQSDKSVGNRLGTAAYVTSDIPELGAIQLDGRGCLDAGDILNFDTDQPFSISCWVRPSERSDSMFVLGRIGKDETRGMRGYDVYVSGGHLLLQLQHQFTDIREDDALVRVSANEPLEPTKWQHIVTTYDGSGQASGISIYVDGEPQQLRVIDDSLDGKSIAVDSPFRIGIRGYAQPQASFDLDTPRRTLFEIGNPMVGHVGDVAVFDRVIANDDIRSIWRVGNQLKRLP